MWTKDQITKSEKLLIEINKTDFNDIENTYISKLDKEFGYTSISEIRSLLLTNKLLYSISDDNFHVKLTPLGNFALIVGMKTFVYLKYLYIFFISVIPIIISIIALLKSNEAIEKVYLLPNQQQSENRNSQTDIIANFVNNDTIFIVKIKESIKQDSVFLNELKDNIKHEKKITTP